MFRKRAALTALGLIGLAGAAYGAAENAQPQNDRAPEARPAPPTDPFRVPNNTNSDGTLKVVVHHDAAPGDMHHAHDGRMDMGGWAISTPDTRTVTMVRDGKVEHHTIIMPGPRADGAVPMPDNTFGPAEPMWVMRERQEAELKLLKANADLARTDADRARPYYNDYTYPRDILAENASFGKFDIGGVGGIGFRGAGGGFGGGGFWGGPVGSAHFRGQGGGGPVFSTTTRDDQLGANAQHEFNRAATPNNAGNQDAHDRAVRQYGNDSLPRINNTQDAVDRAHTNANKEHPTPPPQPR